MPNPITCLYCICFNRGQSPDIFALCRELRREGLCQKQVALREQGIEVVIEGEKVERVGDETRH